MKKSIYQEVLRTLDKEQIYEKKDKHLLIDCLPYSLKNEFNSVIAPILSVSATFNTL